MEGTFEEINRFFYENGWSDGLPIVPPSRGKVERFLEFTDLAADHVIGQLLPDNRQATIWNVAVNGVMAGCRPQYMPVLVSLAEAMADPGYGVEHSGNTPGAETLITINGPIIKDLEFNYEQGALRDGFQANTSIGRWWRLYLRNVAGFILHQTDKGTFGNTWRVVLAENEDALARGRLQEEALEFFLLVLKRLCEELKLPVAIGSKTVGRAAGVAETLANFCRAMEGWRKVWRKGCLHAVCQPARPGENGQTVVSVV